MNIALFFRVSIIIMLFSICLYFYVEKQNYMTCLRIALPQVEQEILQIKEENSRLQYEVDQFENPSHLMDMARSVDYSHLKHPFVHEILTLEEGMAINSNENNEEKIEHNNIPVAIGAK